MIPPAAPRCLTSNESAGEGQAFSAIHTGIPAIETTSAAARANRSEPKRVSYPTSTPAPGFSARTTYRAIAHATLRTLAKVKSSAITPRQPSVPNLIVLTTQQYMRRRCVGKAAHTTCVSRGKQTGGQTGSRGAAADTRLIAVSGIDHEFQEVAVGISHVHAGACSLAP